MNFIFRICLIFYTLNGLLGEEISPGTYRIVGAEGSASLTALTVPLIPDQPDSTKKVSMTPWSGGGNQEWTLIPVTISETLNFFVTNGVVKDNAFSISNPVANVNITHRGDEDYLYRPWVIRQLDNKNWQIYSYESMTCVSRLGLTVYTEGSDCDAQAQSQQWMFIKLLD